MTYGWELYDVDVPSLSSIPFSSFQLISAPWCMASLVLNIVYRFIQTGLLSFWINSIVLTQL